jgi:flagellar biosynthetic protein FliR
MLEEILSLNIYAFLLIFVRAGTTFMLMPGIGGLQVNVRARLLFALALTFLVTPQLADRLPPLPQNPWALGTLVLGEVFAGTVLGTVTRILFAAVQVAGTVISFISAMANALIFDPISEQQSAIVAGFMATIATLLMFVTNLHHMLIQAMFDSYGLFEPGALPVMGDTLELIARQVADTVRIGVRMASPFLVVSFAYYLGLGLLTRLAPQIPIFFVAMPLQIVFALGGLMITISAMMMVFLNHLDEGIRPFLAP